MPVYELILFDKKMNTSEKQLIFWVRIIALLLWIHLIAYMFSNFGDNIGNFWLIGTGLIALIIFIQRVIRTPR